MRTIEEIREFFGNKAVILCNSAGGMRLAAQCLRDNGCGWNPFSMTIDRVLRCQVGAWEQSQYQHICVYRCGEKYDMCGHTGNLGTFNGPVLSVNAVIEFFSEPAIPFTEQEFDAAFADLLR